MKKKDIRDSRATDLEDYQLYLEAHRPVEMEGHTTNLTGDRASNFNVSGNVYYGYQNSGEKEIEESQEELNGKIRKYLSSLYDNQKSVKILLYHDTPMPFYDIYVCNKIHVRYRRTGDRRRMDSCIIENATIKKLAEISNYIIISGNGGLGKSMMMKHILLDMISNYDEYGLFPIFLDLKDYKPAESLTVYAHSKVNEYMPESKKSKISMQAFIRLLDEGKCVFLCDGLDELSSNCRESFEENLSKMMKGYRSNVYVVSSRPSSFSGTYRQFLMMYLCPFNLNQALELVDKLKFREDRPSIKEGFREKLQKDLFRTHKSFTENPLLLTIMMLTYERFAEVPNKMHLFYQEAYLVLSQSHDANKGLTRELYTGLSFERFEAYFAEFCARTYMEEQYQFSEKEFENWFNCLNERREEALANKPVSASAFIKDLTSSMCLMYYDEYIYYFTHRSFQEYFCAVYFSNQDPEFFGKIGDEFEKKDSDDGERAFSMLYEMKPKLVEKYIFLPKLEEVLEIQDGEAGYHYFLVHKYQHIKYSDVAHLEFGGRVNLPSSFILRFIIEQRGVLRKHINFKLLPLEEFIEDTIIRVDQKGIPDEIMLRRIPNHMSLDDFSSYKARYGISDDVEAVCEGHIYDVDLHTILSNPEQYQEFIEQLDADNFPLKELYKELTNYYKLLKDKQKPRGRDLFSYFG